MPPLLDKLGRVLLPLLTPFDERDDVNRKALADRVEHVITPRTRERMDSRYEFE